MPPSKTETQRPIYVWACCGALGYLIPWADWVASGIFPVAYDLPPGVKKHIYLYSIKGQLGHPEREHHVTPKNHPEIPGRIPVALDHHITPHDLQVDWKAIKAEILLAADL